MMGSLGQWGISPWAMCLFALVLVWSFIWKGLSLWKSARKNSTIWFIVLLIVNTVGILDILYIYVFSEMGKKKAAPRARRRRRR